MAVPKQTYKITLIENLKFSHKSGLKSVQEFSGFEKKRLNYLGFKSIVKMGVKNYFL